MKKKNIKCPEIESMKEIANDFFIIYDEFINNMKEETKD